MLCLEEKKGRVSQVGTSWTANWYASFAWSKKKVYFVDGPDE